MPRERTRPPLSAAEEPVAPVADIPPLDDYDYRIQRIIETDSKMSSVVLAISTQQRRVVLKIARVDQRARAETNREAIRNSVLWLRRLGRHDGLVRLYPIAYRSQRKSRHASDYESQRGEGARPGEPVFCATLRQWAGQPEFLVMEYLEGGSLRDYVGARPLGADTALWITHQLAQSLDYIHRQGCVHRDIKPENILFRSPARGDGSGAKPGARSAGRPFGEIRPVLVDFGVAAACRERRLVSGSRLWMAPELQEAYEQSALPVDPAWDIYALGLLLCYMVSGRRPRRRNYEYASVLAYREHTLAVLEQGLQNRDGKTPIYEQLGQLITAMLAKNPADRPAAHEVAVVTAALLADLGVTLSWQEQLRMQLARSRSLPPRQRLQLALVVALVVGVVLGGLAGLFISLPVSVNARDGAQAVEPAAERSKPEPAMLPGDVTPTAARQPMVLQGKSSSTAFLGPEPTRVALSPAATRPPPTLVPFVTQAGTQAPTLVPFTPLPPGVPSAAVTLPPLAVTPTAPAVPPVAPPLRTRKPPASTPPAALAAGAGAGTLTGTPAVQAAAVLEQVQLLVPESRTRSDQGKVEFSWQIGAQPLAEDHCFELVFWNPNRPGDKRSPTGAGKPMRRRVDFTLLYHSSDPLLRALTQSQEDFNWGVRIVACSAPRTVLQDVQQVRIYSYKGQ